MTPDEAMTELVKIFSGPQPPPGKDRWHHLQYIPVQRPDGVVEFVRNAFQVELRQTFDRTLDELFGPEPEPGQDE
jgi:hypothetical protein